MTKDYYSTDDWTDMAIGFVREHRAATFDEPLSSTSPVSDKAKDIAKYRSAYDQGRTRVREVRGAEPPKA